MSTCLLKLYFMLVEHANTIGSPAPINSVIGAVHHRLYGQATCHLEPIHPVPGFGIIQRNPVWIGGVCNDRAVWTVPNHRRRGIPSDHALDDCRVLFVGANPRPVLIGDFRLNFGVNWEKGEGSINLRVLLYHCVNINAGLKTVTKDKT